MTSLYLQLSFLRLSAKDHSIYCGRVEMSRIYFSMSISLSDRAAAPRWWSFARRVTATQRSSFQYRDVWQTQQ